MTISGCQNRCSRFSDPVQWDAETKHKICKVATPVIALVFIALAGYVLFAPTVFQAGNIPLLGRVTLIATIGGVGVMLRGLFVTSRRKSSVDLENESSTLKPSEFIAHCVMGVALIALGVFLFTQSPAQVLGEFHPALISASDFERVFVTWFFPAGVIGIGLISLGVAVKGAPLTDWLFRCVVGERGGPLPISPGRGRSALPDQATQSA